MPLQAEEATLSSESNRGRIFKSVKWGMIGTKGSVLDKFQLQKELGYDGMELVSPSNLDAQEVRAAVEKTGMPVHGVVDMQHWKIRLSSPDAATRARGTEILARAVRDAHAFGGDSVLLVPGKVTGDDETHDDVWQRSIVEIRKVLPAAARWGVRILIENVWNGFCETPELLRDYIDEIDSPWVGAYFDIGNVVKFSPSENWIRTLRRRIVKLDVKDWGRDNGFCKIGDGDVNWPEVRKALGEISFTGWCTAEVGGGGRERLADIAQRMNQALEL
jgi:hexulose-6-phosphate isomerase